MQLSVVSRRHYDLGCCIVFDELGRVLASCPGVRKDQDLLQGCFRSGRQRYTAKEAIHDFVLAQTFIKLNLDRPVVMVLFIGRLFTVTLLRLPRELIVLRLPNETCTDLAQDGLSLRRSD